MFRTKVSVFQCLNRSISFQFFVHRFTQELLEIHGSFDFVAKSPRPCRKNTGDQPGSSRPNTELREP